MKARVGIVRFLGTNCDRDVWSAVESHKPQWMWYEDQYDVKNFDRIVIPGGFSYGDYLRCGALAARSPVMKTVCEAAKKGIPILGICNGFQILCEAGILPGVLGINNSLKFVDQWEHLSIAQENPYWKTSAPSCYLPIAHKEGNYFVDKKTLQELKDREQIWMTYNNNPNGSIDNIAGIMNKAKNVCALMPHPERALYPWMGGEHGRNLFPLEFL